jgi:hypothetical protein
MTWVDWVFTTLIVLIVCWTVGICYVEYLNVNR